MTDQWHDVIVLLIYRLQTCKLFEGKLRLRIVFFCFFSTLFCSFVECAAHGGDGLREVLRGEGTFGVREDKKIQYIFFQIFFASDFQLRHSRYVYTTFCLCVSLSVSLSVCYEGVGKNVPKKLNWNEARKCRGKVRQRIFLKKKK